MRQFWDQLTKSQKRIVTAGLALAGVVLLVQFMVLPYIEARQKTSAAIAASEKTLREMASLGIEYGVLRQRADEIRRASERRPPGFTLFSHVEKRAGDAGVKTNIRSLTPLTPTPMGPYEETAVELKLDRLTLRQLADLLYRVESPEEMIRVKRVSIVKMKESPDYLSASLQVFTYQLLVSGGR